MVASAAQHKIHSLTETINALQAQTEDLQTQVEELKDAQADRCKRDLAEQRRNLGAQSVSCLKELYDLQQEKYLAYKSLRVDRPCTAHGSVYVQDRERDRDPEEEHSALQRSVQTLQAQLASEWGRREVAEQETVLMAMENSTLEQCLAVLEGCQARQRELEDEVEEFRQLWRADYATSASRRPDRMLLPNTVFFPPGGEAWAGSGRGGGAEKEVKEQGRRSLQRCSSESVLRGANADEIQRGHERTCVRRSEAVKQRGISLLTEVDAQYSTLQVKYEELLLRCQQEAQGLSHKAVQMPHSPQISNRTRRRRSSCVSSCVSSSSSSSSSSDLATVPEDGPQPEYKVLFQEIFTRT